MPPNYVLPSNKKDKVVGTIGAGVFFAVSLAQAERGSIIVLPLVLALWCLWLTYNAYSTRLLYSDLAITLECKPAKDHVVDLTRLVDFQYGLSNGQALVYLQDEDDRSLELSLAYFPAVALWGQPILEAVEREPGLFHARAVEDFRETVRTGSPVATTWIGSQVPSKGHSEDSNAPRKRLPRLLARALRRDRPKPSEGQERD